MKSIIRHPGSPNLPPLPSATTTAGGSSCAAAPRSLHRAHRLQSVGMSAGGSDGTAERPAGRGSGLTTLWLLWVA